MVLQKESSILGYPGEISKSMNADHHDLCKYASPDDPNYISVRNALQTLIRDLRQRGQFGCLLEKHMSIIANVAPISSHYTGLRSQTRRPPVQRWRDSGR